VLWSRDTQLHYPFQNTALDYSGNARHGTVHGSGVYATKPNGGRCLYFDGTGDYVATPSFGLSGTVVVFAADVRSKLNSTIVQSFLTEPVSNTVGFLYLNRGPADYYLYTAYATGSGVGDHSTANYFAGGFEDTWLSMLVAWDYGGKRIYVYRKGVMVDSATMSGTPVFPSTNRAKTIGRYVTANYITDGYLANVQLWTLATMPAAAQMLPNVNRIMLGLHPIW